MQANNTRNTPNLHALGQAVYIRREDLRYRAHSIACVARIAQRITVELEFEKGDRSEFSTTGTLHALLNVMEHAGSAFEHDIAQLVGEDDEDLLAMLGGEQ